MFSPGHSPGGATLEEYRLTGDGVLRLEIDGDDPAQADHLRITGEAHLDGGSIELDFSGYSGSGSGRASFSGLLQVDGRLSNQATLRVSGLGNGARYQAQWNGGALDLHRQSAVPEPGSLALMLAGLARWAGLARRGRRREDDRAG